MSIHIRPMQAADLPQLATYWYDKMALVQQYHPRIELAPDAQSHWQHATSQHIKAHPQWAFTALYKDAIIGGIIGATVANQPGLIPDKIGEVQALLIDLHASHGAGAAHMLVDALRYVWLQEQVMTFTVTHWSGILVEDAFWRSVGIKKMAHTYWIQS